MRTLGSDPANTLNRPPDWNCVDGTEFYADIAAVYQVLQAADPDLCPYMKLTHLDIRSFTEGLHQLGHAERRLGQFAMLHILTHRRQWSTIRARSLIWLFIQLHPARAASLFTQLASAMAKMRS
jgi:hypothetical protein